MPLSTENSAFSLGLDGRLLALDGYTVLLDLFLGEYFFG
jgi:hypothetical protein